MLHKKRLVISFDLDGVIFPLVQSICKEYGISYNKITSHNIWECDLLSDVEKEIIVNSFGKKSTYEKCGVSDGAEMLGELSELADVYINSWCIGEDREYKREVLRRLALAIPDDHIFFGESLQRKEYVPSDFIVEDNLRNIRENLDRGKCFLLIDAPYNREEVEKTIRVRNLKECMTMLMRAVKRAGD